MNEPDENSIESDENIDDSTEADPVQRVPRNVKRLRRAHDLISAVIVSLQGDVGALRDDLCIALEYISHGETAVMELPTKAPRMNPFTAGTQVIVTPDGREVLAYLGEIVNTVGKLVNDSPGRNRWVVAFHDGTKTVISKRMLELVIGQ